MLAETYALKNCTRSSNLSLLSQHSPNLWWKAAHSFFC